MFERFSDQEILAKTAYGENRGGGSEGMQSVLNVIMNRANSGIEWFGETPRGVCLRHDQFDCWLPTDPNYAAIINVTDSAPVYATAIDLAGHALEGTLEDITDGSRYYFAKSMPRYPVWAKGKTPVAEIAGQLFFNNIDS